MRRTRLFRDRSDAGQQLAELLGAYAHRQDVVVLALPRGGVPVAFEVAKALNAPLDVLLVRKLGVPGQEELAMGAIASGGISVLNEAVISALQISEDEIERVREHEEKELVRRERLYRDDRPQPEVSGRIVILIDDGLATGASMRSAARALRQRHPARLVIAVPVASPSTCLDLQDEADEIVCAMTPEPFYGVGQWYEDFSQTSDEEVHDLLARAAQETSTAH
jgi:putative phosphoribosyl transferase